MILQLQMRRYIQKRQQRLQQSQTTNHSSFITSFSNRYTVSNDTTSAERTDRNIVLRAQQTESRTDAEIAAASKSVNYEEI